MFTYYINEEGKTCLLSGIAGGALGWFVGRGLDWPLTFMFTGVGLGFLLVDAIFRAREFARAPGIGVLFSSNRGGHFDYIPCYLMGIGFLALAGFAFTQGSRIAAEDQRKADLKKEAERLEKITQNLPRDGFDLEVGDKEVFVTNKHGKDFVKVKIWADFSLSSGTQKKELDWDSWKNGEQKTLVIPFDRSALMLFSISMAAFPADGADIYYRAFRAAKMEKGKLVPIGETKGS